jgi:hypothetical protein
VDLRAGLDVMEIRKFFTLPGLELRPLGLPARSQSLYRIRYPGSLDQPSVLQNHFLAERSQSVASVDVMPKNINLAHSVNYA